MAATAFNPLATAQDLEAAGFERRQAEAIAEGMRQAAGVDRGTFATKADLVALQAATKADLDALQAATKADLAKHRGAAKAELAEHRATTKADLTEHRAAAKADLAEHRATTKADHAEHRAATKADLTDFATKADLHREIGALRSEMRWMFGFLAAIILAMAAKLFGIV